MPNPFRSLSIAALCLCTFSAFAQQNTPADRLASARAYYYNPTASGLKSFRCDVTLDWKAFMAAFGAGDLAPDNPFLVYLNSVKLSITDDLRGAGTLEWNATGTPPGGEDGINKIREGLTQMVSGFFQSWNPFLNGEIVPTPDKDTTITPADGGLHIHAKDGDTVVDQDLDKNMLMTQMHVVSSALDVVAVPTFNETSNGRIITSLHSILHQPPTAPATDVTMSAQYATVSSFQIPSSLSVSLKNVGSFVFNLSPCTVQTANHGP